MTSNIFAESPKVSLVFDRWQLEDAHTYVARRYRTLDWLHASASSQFSADELHRILRVIPVAKQNIWIIDTRQESHGFIDGIPVSWRGKKNAANINKTAAQIQSLENCLLEELRQKKTVTVYTLEKLPAGDFIADRPEILIPEQIESEKQLVTSLGANYKRLYVLDHNKPDDVTVDEFVLFVKNKVKAGDWLHFHCRGGSGRSSTFMAMYDMLLNGKQTSFAKIMQRQAKAGNVNISVPDYSTDKEWKVDDFKVRAEFLKEFYAYVIDKNGYPKNSWTVWKKMEKKKAD